MFDASEFLTTRPIRRDGWTPQRRQRFLELLAAGFDVRRACAGVGMSRQTAYALRRREPAFARGWDDALRSARVAADAALLAILPENLLRTMSELSGECNFRGHRGLPQDDVRVVRGV